MGLEIEYKYLVKNTNFKAMAESSLRIRQGYLSRNPERVVRVRTKGDRGYLTVKGKNHGASRLEFEYEIPFEDAEKMLSLCEGQLLDKIRYLVPYEGHVWEVDEFLGNRLGLVTAEIELESEDTPFSIPDFIGENVTGNPAYYNSNL
ncbi:MAG: CYTH domain-containing protein [Muribaculaceae bacterium]|nr:CYTH domain-containing protein [Muribaculaceae bacterium]